MSPAIGLLELDILIPTSQSLKDKRQVIRSLKDKIRSKLNVSVAEVGYIDLYQRAHLGIITISVDRAHAEKRLQSALEIAGKQSGAEIIEEQIQWL